MSDRPTHDASPSVVTNKSGDQTIDLSVDTGLALVPDRIVHGIFD